MIKIGLRYRSETDTCDETIRIQYFRPSQNYDETNWSIFKFPTIPKTAYIPN